MTLGRKGLTSGAIKGSTVCCAVFHIMCCVLFYYVNMLLCRTIQNSIQTSPLSVFLSDHWVPAGNRRLGPG
ncbi:unnamed protein product, partial [Staurois parvus]